MSARRTNLSRTTRETRIAVDLDVDGGGAAVDVATGIGFLDHLLTALACHAGWSLHLECSGDLEVDDHHTAEDCALALGGALRRVVDESGPVARFGWAWAPLDEALARAVVDLGGRPWPEVHLGLERERIGALATENVAHVLVSLAMAAGAAVHVDVVRGANDHHRAEAAFKALALAVRQATRPTADLRSTKGAVEVVGGGDDERG